MSITEVEDLTLFCRVCLQLPEDSDLLDLNLIYDEEEQLTYYDCFTMCTQIHLGDDEGLPQNLCRSCGLELQMAYDFYKKVEESKRFLTQLQDQQSEAEAEAVEETTTLEVVQEEETTTAVEEEVALQQEQEPEFQSEEGEHAEQEEHTEEEHLEMEEYQTLEHVDDEDNVQYIYIADPKIMSQPMLQIMTPPSHTMNTISEDSSVKLNIHNNQIPKQQHRYKFSQRCSNYDEVISYTPRTAPSIKIETFCPKTEDDASTVALPITQVYKLHQPETPDISTNTKRRLPRAVKRPQPPSSYTCSYCQKVFAKRSRMLWHRRIHDQNRVKYPCPHADCKRVYATKQASEVHYKQSHLEEGLECPVCNKVFSVRQVLEVHMRYHNGDFPYACEQCDKRFGQKGHLTTHMQVKHNNLRYCCTVPGCMKTFKNSMSLRNHSFVHSEMPFQCAYCEKGYPQKSKLRFHINVKHNIEVSYEDLETMRKFQESRSRYTFMKLDTPSEDNDELREDVAAVE